MNSAQFDGRTIIVYLETLPDEKSIEMTSTLLLNSNSKNKKIDTRDLSTYPFYSNKHAYSWKYCMDYGFKYSADGYSKFIKLFFDRNEFSKLIQQSANETSGFNSDINKYNIQIMMNLLLPTKMPTEYNFTDSLNEYILNNGKANISFKAQSSMLSNYPIQFSYISIQNKPYTVLKVTWLNDIMNNPIYRIFFENFIKFNEWKQGAISTTIEKINFLMNRLVKRLYVKSKDESENDFIVNVNLKQTSDYNKIVKTVDDINKTPNQNRNQYNTSSKTEFNERVKDLLEQIDSLYNIIFIFKQDENSKYYTYIEPDLNNLPEELPRLARKITNNIPDNSTFEALLFQKSFKGFDFININNNIDIIKKIYDISVALDKNIKTIQSTQGGVLQITKDFMSKISNIVSMSKDAYVLYQIFINYIGSSKINTTLPKDEDILKELNDNFPNVVSFISAITPISKSSRNSSNGDLQDIINKYVGNEQFQTEYGLTGFDDLLNRCNDLFIRSKILVEKGLDDNVRLTFMNTGLVELMNIKPNTPKYEIYISLQLAEGEFTEPNQCLYREYFLGNTMENWFLNKSRYLEYKSRFILYKEDIDRYIKQSQINEQNAEIPIVNTITNASSIFRKWFNSTPQTAAIADTVQKSMDNIATSANQLITNATNGVPSANVVPANVVPANVVPSTNVVPANGVPANVVPSSEPPTNKVEIKGGMRLRTQSRPSHKRRRKTFKKQK